jgi:hypothetical protein
MKKFGLGFVGLLVVVSGLWVCVSYYSYVFSKRVHGTIEKVERVSQPALVATGAAVPVEQLFSYAVAIKDEKGEIHTASSEDRQWSVAQPGQCAEAMFMRYPFWELDKAGTFFGSRLVRLYDCGKQ